MDKDEMSTNQLFVISYDMCELEEEYSNGWTVLCSGFYYNLETVKEKLKSIWRRTNDFKMYGYRINVYDLVDNEYVMNTNKKYTYKFNEFTETITT